MVRPRCALLCLAALVVFSTLSGCEQESLDADVSAAHSAFVAAVKNKDAGALFDMAPAEVRTYFDTLYSTLTKVVADVKDKYPAVEREPALEALAAERLEGVTSGRELFAALLDLEAVHGGEDVDRGLEAVSIQKTDTDATVQTAAGESFVYVMEDGKWKAATIRAQLERYPSVKRLRANIQTAHNNLQTWAKATTETLDPTKPEGAFNVVVQAVQRGARVMLFEQLDEVSRKHLADALVAVKALQSHLEARFPKADARRKYLAERKLEWAERVADQKSLFAGMWDSGMFAKELTFEGDITVKSTEAGESAEDQWVVASVADVERRLLFRRALDGKYRLAALEAAILREGARKFEAELRAVPAGKEQPK